MLDERGRPTDYKDLGELRARLALVMSRFKNERVGPASGGTVNTFYMTMTEAQKPRYADFETPAFRLIALAQRRPLRKEEFDRLPQLLACISMICDTPYVLEPACRVSPKLYALANILAELLAEQKKNSLSFGNGIRRLNWCAP